MANLVDTIHRLGTFTTFIDMLGQLELLDIPGRWGRNDAFGRGRVDTSSVEDSAQLS